MDEKITGTIFDIQRFSLSDGQGIRTTVFLKGCPLNCEWCHNPESISKSVQIIYHKNKCTLCGACEIACVNNCHKVKNGEHFFNSKNCVKCNECVNKCTYGGLETIGKTVTVEEIISAVLEDLPFYESSNGGLTISGGEPMFQPDFVIAIAKMAKEKGVHVCLDTSGFCKTEKLLEISKYVDVFLFDYKATGDMHEKLIGKSNELILNNLFALDNIGAKIIFRCPIVPTKNLKSEHINGIIKTAKKLNNLVEINLVPYHNIGLSKREGLGLITPEAISPPTIEEMQKLAQDIEKQTKVKTIVV